MNRVQDIFSRELNLKSFAQVELNHCHQRDGLRPGSIADANESLRAATKQSGEREVQGELTKRPPARPWAKGGKILDTAALRRQTQSSPAGSSVKLGLSRDQKEIVVQLIP